MKTYAGALLIIISLNLNAQFNIGGMVKDKALDLGKKAARKQASDYFEKQRKEFDESNFNYAISFLDNSGTFEADEKGSALTNSLKNVTKYFTKEDNSVEERAYNNLRNGELLMAGNKYWLAEQSLLLAKFLYETESLTSSPNYAQTISDLGLLYQSRGRFAKALQYDLQALELRKSGENKGMMVVSVNNLAVLKKQTGTYSEALTGLKDALQLARNSDDKLAQALIHNNMAMTQLDMNELNAAETEMRQSLDLAAAVMKDNSANFIKLQINMASIYRVEKKYTDAEAIYQKAIAVKEAKLGAHPDLAHLKMGLAELYMDMGKTSEVEKLLLSAVDIDKRKLGEKDPATLAAQQALGNYYRFSNQTDKSLTLLSAVNSQKKEIYGSDNPVYLQSLEDLSLTQWVAGQNQQAKSNYSLVINGTLAYINGYFHSLNEHEKTSYWDKTNSRLQRYYAFATSQGESMVPEVYNTVVSSKGFLLNNSVKIRQAILGGADDSLKALYQQWLDTKENLNVAFQMSKEERDREKVNFDSLRQRSEDLERKLSSRSALFAGMDARPVSADDIQKSLGATEAAIEIIEVEEYKNGFTGKSNYIAILLTKASKKMVSLGPASSIDDAINQYRAKIIDLKPESEAYGIVWKPLDQQLQGISTIYLSQDGGYHQLSVYALKDAGGKYLADKYQIVLCGNTADVPSIRKNEADKIKPSNVTIFANPAYGKNDLIPPLPGAEAEARTIAKQLVQLGVPYVVNIGTKATESTVKQVDNPAVLHIATHGYFLASLDQMETNRVLGVDIGAARENPLLRCGVLFANCENVFDDNYKPSQAADNGVLTAYEAMSLKLDKTDLVVLSACETGLGSVKQGEGVYGLQRAFMVAGARSVIMSLWSVSDDATRDLMTFFYSSYLKSGNKTQAFSEAIRQLKVKYKEPFYWSAFVMLQR